MKYKTLVISLITILLVLCGCAHTLISKYDKETHKNMAYLKPSIDTLYSMYGNSVINIRYTAQLDNRFKLILAYERSKGDPNSDTVKQIEIVYKMFEQHLQERLKFTKWPKEHNANKLKNIQNAIDLVIESERLKNE